MNNFKLKSKKTGSVLLMMLLTVIGLLSFSNSAKALNEDPVIFTPQVSIPGSSFTAKVSSTLEYSTGPIARYISAIYNYGVGIVGIVAAMMLMIGGIIWLTAAGSSSKIEQAKSFITSSLTGMVLVVTAVILLRTVNPALVDLKVASVENIKEIALPLIYENCTWKISYVNYTTVNNNTLKTPVSGCDNREVSVNGGTYCTSTPSPTSAQLKDEGTSENGKFSKKPECCCSATAYGVAAQTSGSDVINVDTSGVYWCCNVIGELIDKKTGDHGKDSKSFGNIQSNDRSKAEAKCQEFKKTVTKTLGGVLYYYQDSATATLASGKCTATFADNDPLKDQCKGQSEGTPCKLDSSKPLGSGYCVSGLCKKCLTAGEACYNNYNNFECAGSDGLCGHAGANDANCYRFDTADPDLTICRGRPASIGSKVNVGEDCHSNNECTSGCCVDLSWHHNWCFPTSYFNPSDHDLKCM